MLHPRRTQNGTRTLRAAALTTSLAMVVLPVFAARTGGAAAPRTNPLANQNDVTFQMTPGHTGTSSDPVGPQWTMAWTATAGGPLGYPLIAGGQIFELSDSTSPTLIAYDASSGTVDWQDGVGAHVTGIAYDGGRVFEQSGDVMTAFNAATGAQDWSASLPNQYSFSSAPTASGGIVYTDGAGSGGTLYALSETSGTLLWTMPVQNGDESSPAVGGNSVYVSFACDLTQAFNANSGTALWTHQTGCEGGGGQTSVLGDGDLFLRDVALNASTGAAAHSIATTTAPAVDSTNLYTEDSGTLQAASVTNNAVLWTFTGDGHLDSPPIVDNGVVYVGSSSGELYGVSAATGQTLWSTNVGSPITFPQVGFTDSYWGLGEGDGLLVVPTGDTLTVFDNTGSVPAAPSAVTATRSNASATVNWTVPANQGSAITDYTITPSINGVAQSPTVIPVGASGSATSPTPGDSDTFTVAGLTNGSSYTFAVAADNAGGTGPNSPSSNAVTPATSPSPPLGASALAGYQGAQVSWTVGQNGGFPITDFLITPTMGTTPQPAITVPAGAVGSPTDPTPGAVDTYDVSGLTGGDSYTFTVAAETSFATGNASAPTGAVTPSGTATVPYPPSAVSATVAGTQVTVHWTVPGANGSPISGFTITPATSGSTPAPITVSSGATGSATSPTPGASDSAVVPNLTVGSTYTFSVSARNAAGTGSPSASSNAVTPEGPQLSVDPNSLSFGSLTVGNFGGPENFQLTNSGTTSVDVTNVLFGGSDPNDFTVDPFSTTCDVLDPGQSCVIGIDFFPGALGVRTGTVIPVVSAGTAPVVSLTGVGTEGYYEATAQGVVKGFGDAVALGDLSKAPPKAPIVSIQTTGDDGGFWMAGSDGSVYDFGDASSYGSTGGAHLNKPIVGMTPTPDYGGYWLVASDGGIFSFGDAAFYGSTGALRLNKPVVGMAPTPDGGGYWLVASDGGIFSYGDAKFYGSTGGLRLNKPVVGMAVTPDGGGYWLVASDGGIFSYGDAKFYGSTGALHLNKPIVGMSPTPDGFGYWLVASDGGIFSFGDAPFYGSTGGSISGTGTIGIAGTAPPTIQAYLDIPADHPQARSRQTE